MDYEIPEYRKTYGSYHNSASGATQPLYEHLLKLYLRKEMKMNFPFAARPRAGQIVQSAVDYHLGLDEYSPLHGRKEGMDIEKAVTKARTEYMTYQPRTFDDGKDREEYEHFKSVIDTMTRHAVEGLHEYFGDGEIEGEYQRWHQDDWLDVPTMLFQDYCGQGKQIDLKCSFPMRNPVRKDGTRTWRNPKPKTEPTPQQLIQQAVYWKATGDKPALLFVTPEGWHICDDSNCELMKPEYLEEAYLEARQRWYVVQTILQSADGSWKNLFSYAQPDFGLIGQRHGPEILKLSKQLWRLESDA